MWRVPCAERAPAVVDQSSKNGVKIGRDQEHGHLASLLFRVVVSQVGLSLTIPMTIVTDVVRRKPLYVWDFIGAVCVVTGFLCITVSPEKGADMKPSELETDGTAEYVRGPPSSCGID